MKNTLLVLLALATLSACTNTRAGIQEDSRRMGERMQAVTMDLSAP